MILRGLAVVALLAAALVGWRVLGPAEVLETAAGPYPAPSAPPGVTGRTAAAPLIVDDRIRVFAAKRAVKADGPVDLRTTYTPRWSYRRWPQQLAGVVAVGSTVITRWSDGRLVAIDGRAGRVAWRADAPRGSGYTGDLTGAATVWHPPGLHTAGGAVVVTGGGRVAAFDAASGQRLWETTADGDCFTLAGGQVVCGGRCVGPVTCDITPVTPLGCGTARSGCAAVRDANGHVWLVDGPSPRRAPALDPPGSTVAAGLALTVTGGTVAARDPVGGTRRWSWSAPAGQSVTILGEGAQGVRLLRSDGTLATVGPDGTERPAIRLAVGSERTDWTAGGWQSTPGYLVVERRTRAGGPFATETCVIAAG